MGFTSSAITAESTVKTFSGGERQGVAITRALYFKAELIILDEPTMGLSLSETKKCLDFVAGIKAAGKSAIFIDHNIFHVYPVADRIVVLDRGTMAGQFMKNELTLQELIDRLYLVAQTGSLIPRPDGARGENKSGGKESFGARKEQRMSQAPEAGRPLSPTARERLVSAYLREVPPPDRHRLRRRLHLAPLSDRLPADVSGREYLRRLHVDARRSLR